LIVVFGGAFNPPTIAHEAVARHLLRQEFCKSLLFLPVGDAYPKPGLVPVSHRVEMLGLACIGLENAKVSLVEAECLEPLPTLKSLERIQSGYPGHEVSFVVGADNLLGLHTWFKWETLLSKFYPIVFRRDGIDIDSLIEKHFSCFRDRFIILSDFSGMAVSSTAYRGCLDNDSMVSGPIGSYIKRHHLYGR